MLGRPSRAAAHKHNKIARVSILAVMPAVHHAMQNRGLDGKHLLMTITPRTAAGLLKVIVMRLRPNRYAIPADAAPDDPVLTPYDIEHMITYFRVLDADAHGAD